ncbi:MAG: GDP-mannose 4,6-dehydratase, partial [Pseudomonadales bacterium]|nr:GDP-mannose 4,6-dehydratase [Pseudomonadales bacterium]
GPYHFPEKLIPLCLINILFGRPLPIYGDGQQIRDWLYVTDHCRGIEAVIERGQLGETYNIGGNNEKSNLEVVTTLCTLLDQAFAANPELAVRFPDAPAARGLASRTLITHVQDRAGHDRRYAIDARKIEQALQFRPLESFESGIARTVTWYLDHEAWWREVMDGSYRDWIQRQYG